MSTPNTPPQNQKPQWHLRNGALEVACWKSVVNGGDGKNRDFFTVTLQRSFKDKADAWKNSQSLRRQDLLAAARLLEQAYDKLSSKAADDEV